MKLDDAKNRFVFNTKIFLKDIESDTLTEEYLIMREPNMTEVARLGDDEEENKKTILSIMPDCIIGSSFEKNDGTFAKGKEAFNVINSSATTTTDVLNQWLAACPFTSRKQKEES